MEKNGDKHYSISKYISIYGDRMEVVKMPFSYPKGNIIEFNVSCKNLRVKYDYSNTFFFQVLKAVFKKMIFDKTRFKRMCAEDVQRQFNI